MAEGISPNSLQLYNIILEGFGYKKVSQWKPKYDVAVPARRTCIHYNSSCGKCVDLRRTYCKYEDCNFFKDRKEK